MSVLCYWETPYMYVCFVIERQPMSIPCYWETLHVCSMLLRDSRLLYVIERHHVCSMLLRDTHTCFMLLRDTHVCSMLLRDTHVWSMLLRDTHVCSMLLRDTLCPMLSVCFGKYSLPHKSLCLPFSFSSFFVSLSHASCGEQMAYDPCAGGGCLSSIHYHVNPCAWRVVIMKDMSNELSQWLLPEVMIGRETSYSHPTAMLFTGMILQ